MTLPPEQQKAFEEWAKYNHIDSEQLDYFQEAFLSGWHACLSTQQPAGELVGQFPRMEELAIRLVAAGPKASHVSCSETHEIADFILEVIDHLTRHPSPAAPVTAPDDHPERICQRCGGPNPTWFAPNDLWNKYSHGHGILCPICFVQEAEMGGFKPTAWRVDCERLETSPAAPVTEAAPASSELTELRRINRDQLRESVGECVPPSAGQDKEGR
jgi:hypothetical protein